MRYSDLPPSGASMFYDSVMFSFISILEHACKRLFPGGTPIWVHSKNLLPFLGYFADRGIFMLRPFKALT